MKQRLARMELPVIYSGPYSYGTAPIELVFGALKFGELNPNKLPTGKRYVHVFSIFKLFVTLALC